MTDTSPLAQKPVCQVGFVVRSIDDAATALSRLLGVPKPNVIVTDAPDKAKTVYRGAPTPARAKLAFFQIGDLSLELIEPFGGPSTWQEFLDAHGSGIHHIAFQIQGTDRAVAWLEGEGAKLVQQGRYTGGMYTYIEGPKSLPAVLELLENFRP